DEYTLFLPLVIKQEGTLLAVTPQQPAPYRVGQVLHVDIHISAAQPVRAIAAAMTFNPGVIRCQAVQAGPFLIDWAVRNNVSVNFQAGSIDNHNGVIFDSVIRLAGKPADARQPVGPGGSGAVLRYDCTVVGAGISYLNLIKAVVLDNDNDLPNQTNVEIRNAQVEVNVMVSSVGQTHIDARVESIFEIAVDAQLPEEGLAARFTATQGSLQVSSNNHYQVEVIQTGSATPIAMQALGFRVVNEPRGTLLVGRTDQQVKGERLFALTMYAGKRSEQSGMRLLIYHSFILV
ncbi:MAG: hypothetical protein AB1453_13840, partial [Chloroflexota bacterium]